MPKRKIYDLQELANNKLQKNTNTENIQSASQSFINKVLEHFYQKTLYDTFYEAITTNNIDLFEEALSSISDINKIAYRYKDQPIPLTPLEFVIMVYNDKNNKFSINKKESHYISSEYSKQTALLNQSIIIQTFCNKGSDVNKKNEISNKTPLELAISKNDIISCTLLLKAGANLVETDSCRDKVILYFAIMNILEEKTCDDKTDKKNIKLLMLASFYKETDNKIEYDDEIVDSYFTKAVADWKRLKESSINATSEEEFIDIENLFDNNAASFVASTDNSFYNVIEDNYLLMPLGNQIDKV